MRTGTAEMVEDLLIATTCIFKSISEDSKPLTVEMAGGQVAVVVGRSCQRDDGWRLPSGVERYRAEWVANSRAEGGDRPIPLRRYVPGNQPNGIAGSRLSNSPRGSMSFLPVAMPGNTTIPGRADLAG